MANGQPLLDWTRPTQRIGPVVGPRVGLCWTRPLLFEKVQFGPSPLPKCIVQARPNISISSRWLAAKVIPSSSSPPPPLHRFTATENSRGRRRPRERDAETRTRSDSELECPVWRGFSECLPVREVLWATHRPTLRPSIPPSRSTSPPSRSSRCLSTTSIDRPGRAGVPMEVMGLMLGEFVDEYTVRVVDVFAMPQSGTGVSVEAVDHVFQTNMLDMLKQTGRPEMVVGWYHSHPGFGCWLSGVDINTQQSFEALNQRAVAVVVDPIQSVKGKVVIDAFRLINPQTMMLGQEPRQTTSNLGHLNKPSIQALIHGLNRHYYSIAINYRKNELEEKMLLNLHKKKWTDGLTLRRFDTHSKTNEQTVQEMLNLAIKYNKAVQEEDELPPEKLAIANVGRQDAKKHLEEHVSNLMSSNIVQTLGTMLDTTLVGFLQNLALFLLLACITTQTNSVTDLLSTEERKGDILSAGH
ncbi:26S proteasome regulatory subunit RPN11 [Psidium guajava]|nr:26S proteasome regulatory subunit RPN11 [Psidium guajava]